MLTGRLAVVLYGFHHRRGVGEHLVVGVDDALKRRGLHSIGNEFRVRLGSIGPLLAASFIEPHAADVLQETCCAVDTALVGEVAVVAHLIYYSVFGFYTHQAPCAAAEVGELLVLCRHGCHGTSCVVSCHCHHRHSSQSGHLLHFRRQRANLCGGIDHLAETVARQAYALQQFLVQQFCLRIEHLTG